MSKSDFTRGDLVRKSMGKAPVRDGSRVECTEDNNGCNTVSSTAEICRPPDDKQVPGGPTKQPGAKPGTKPVQPPKPGPPKGR